MQEVKKSSCSKVDALIDQKLENVRETIQELT